MINLPTFLIIGAAKAGTTTVFDLLKQHPQVFLPFVKEPMFFSHDDNYCKGLDWYSQTYFKGSKLVPARGEATPHYLYWSEKTAHRIRVAYRDRDVKLVVVLRDPVTRAYSWYGNMLKDGTEPLSFEEALEIEEARIKENYFELHRTGSMQYGYFRGGCYASLLQPFLDLFPRRDFHFILQEDIIENHRAMTSDLLKFIGVDPGIDIDQVRSNPASMPKSKALHKWLRQPGRLKDYLKKIIPFEMRYKLKVRVMNSNLKSTKIPEMDLETKTKLKERYRNEVVKLQTIIDRDLSKWLI